MHDRVAVASVQKKVWLLCTAYEWAVYFSHNVISYRAVPPDQVTRVSDRLESKSKPVRAPRSRRLLLKNEVTLIRIAWIKQLVS